MNLQVGRTRATELGVGPQDRDGVDFAAADRLLPRPVHAPQGYVCVVSPGAATSGLVLELLREAHAHSRVRIRPRR